MNIENINKAIAVMQRAGARDLINMFSFQTLLNGKTAADEGDLHTCGNKACFAGYLALSPEWRESDVQGMKLSSNNIGAPISLLNEKDTGTDPEYLIGKWLGIPVALAEMLIYHYQPVSRIKQTPAEVLMEMHEAVVNGSHGRAHSVYGVSWNDVRAEHVISALETIRDNGVKKAMEIFSKKWEDTDFQISPDILQCIRNELGTAQ